MPRGGSWEVFFLQKNCHFLFVFSLSAENFRTLAKNIGRLVKTAFSVAIKPYWGKTRFLETKTYWCTFKIRAKDYQTVGKNFFHGFQNLISCVQRNYGGKIIIFERPKYFKTLIGNLSTELPIFWRKRFSRVQKIDLHLLGIFWGRYCFSEEIKFL